MASQQDLKRRIRSVRNTRKITKAMELVAGARLRRAEARIQAMRPYADRMRELMIGTARAAGPGVEPSTRCSRCATRSASVAIVAVTGDRGLAGPFNSQMLRRAFALERELRAREAAPRWLVVGKKGRSTLTFRRYELAGAWVGFTDRPAYSDAGADRPPRHRALRRRGRSTRVVHRLQPLHLAAHAGGRDDRPPAGPAHRARGGGGEDAVRDRPRRATSSTSRSPRRSSSASCPRTSRRRSIARCSSPPPRSSARG